VVEQRRAEHAAGATLGATRKVDLASEQLLFEFGLLPDVDDGANLDDKICCCTGRNALGWAWVETA
jgi:hypothetical protein